MWVIHNGQSALRLTVKTFCNLNGVQSAAIRFQKPDGSGGEFRAGVTDKDKGIIIHECIEGEINMSGWWVFWAFITFDDGRTAAGRAAKVYIWEAGRGA
jgi:hypothetical protein